MVKTPALIMLASCPASTVNQKHTDFGDPKSISPNAILL